MMRRFCLPPNCLPRTRFSQPVSLSMYLTDSTQTRLRLFSLSLSSSTTANIPFAIRVSSSFRVTYRLPRAVVFFTPMFRSSFVRTGTPTKVGVPVRTKELLNIGVKNTTARGSRYVTLKELDTRIANGMLAVVDEERDKENNLKRVWVESVKYIESETGWLNRVLGKQFGGKQNLLIMNDEAHHAYRIRSNESDDDDDDEDDDDYELKEATVWVEGLDRIHKGRGINFCLDFSATPFFLGRVGRDTNRPFPWVVSDFGLIEAIESGLVKIPQLAVRDSTGAD